MIIKYRRSSRIKNIHIALPGTQTPSDLEPMVLVGPEIHVYLLRSRGCWKVYRRTEPISILQQETDNIPLSSADVLEILAAAEEEPGAIEIVKQALTMEGYL